MKYRISQTVRDTHGFQTWTVDADTPEEALELHEAGQSDFEMEEVEVVSLEPAKIDDVEEA